MTVMDTEDDTQANKNKGDSGMTVLDSSIVMTSSCPSRDRHGPRADDDADDANDDADKKIVIERRKGCNAISGTCKGHEANDDHDDVSGSPSRVRPSVEDLDADQLAALKEFERRQI